MHFTYTYANILHQLVIKLKAYSTFLKLRLASLVIFSSVAGYIYASLPNWDVNALIWLIIGGLCIVGASNGINQIIEKETDSLMKRTENRPLVTGSMHVSEAIFIATSLGILGVIIIALKLNFLSAILALISLLSYAFIYTPLKKITPIAVFIGAFPGALPVLIGYTAYSNAITIDALLLFAIQFMWQFPHFWSIAWVLNDDYNRAGFKMLPNRSNPDKKTAVQILLYTITLIPLSISLSLFGFNLWISGIIGLIMSIIFSYQSYKLVDNVDNASARKLMFGSFLYLPVVQIAYLIDKII